MKSIHTTQLIGDGPTLKKIISTNWIFLLTQPDIWNAKQAENQGQRLRPTKYILGKTLNWKNPPNAQIVGVGVAWYKGCVKLSTKSGEKDFRFIQLSTHRWIQVRQVHMWINLLSSFFRSWETFTCADCFSSIWINTFPCTC